MLVFVDESGDSGMKGKAGSSERFVVTVVVFEDHEEANRCDARINTVRHELGMSDSQEFHFSHTSDRKRVAFFQAVSQYNFWYYSFSLNKNKTWEGAFSDRESFYKHVMRFIFQNLGDDIKNAIVKMDHCGSESFRGRLAKHLRSRINREGEERVIKDVRMEDSAKNNLIQLADMVCGAIVRSLGTKKKADAYASLIRKRSRGLRQWP